MIKSLFKCTYSHRLLVVGHRFVDSDNDTMMGLLSENSDPDHYQRLSTLTTLDDPVLLVADLCIITIKALLGDNHCLLIIIFCLFSF